MRIGRMAAYNFEKNTSGKTTAEWYKSGNLNLDNKINYGYFIYYYYFGNYPYGDTAKNYLSYNDKELVKKGLLYPSNSMGPRAKIMQDIVTDAKEDKQFINSHAYPNALYTDGSVLSLQIKSLKAQRRSDVGITHYW
jgi:hypothetical protein